MTYKCNIDVSFNLPSCTGLWVDSYGEHCALGKLYAGVLGRPLVFSDDDDTIQKLDDEFIRKIKIIKKYSAIWETNDGSSTCAPNHEKALRLALQYALECGFIELEDSELALVKELQE